MRLDPKMEPAVRFETLDEALDWLRELERITCYGDRLEQLSRRKLLDAEFQIILHILRDLKPLISLSSSMYGFEYGAFFHRESVFPGVPPQTVFHIHESILPTYPDPGPHTQNYYSEKNDNKEIFWNIFGEYAHTEENKRRLDFAGLEAPRDRSYYDY